MLKGLPTRLNLLTENASEWNVFAFYPSLHWEVLHSSPVPVSHRLCRSWRSRFSSPSVLSRRSTTFRPLPLPLPPSSSFPPPSPATDVTTLPYQVSGSTPSHRSSSHVSAHLSNVKKVTHRRNPTKLMRPGTFWKLMWCEIFPKYFLLRRERCLPDLATDIKLLAALRILSATTFFSFYDILYTFYKFFFKATTW